MVNRDFWKGKRVFVTGHTGFKGSWLVLWLHSLGADVAGYALCPPTNPSLFELAVLEKKICSFVGDIRNFQNLKASIDQHQPDIVFHLAAQALIRRSYKDPLETYSTNIMGTATLLEALRSVSDVRSVVVVTSDKCYENREWVLGYREADPMGGDDPYSSSKGCTELIVNAYCKSFFGGDKYSRRGFGLASVRAGNVIGGGDWAEDRIIPDIMRSFMKGLPVKIRSPHAVRPWQHVLDALHGYLSLAEALYGKGHDFSGAWNFGPPDSEVKPVSWLVEKSAFLWGDGARFELDRDINPPEASVLKLDCSKARTKLSWSPRLCLDDALSWTIDWYRQYSQDLTSVLDFTLRQLNEFTSLLQ